MTRDFERTAPFRQEAAPVSSAAVPVPIPLLMLLLAVAILLCGLVVAMMARMLLRPTRMSDAKALYLMNRLTPDDLGLASESLRFSVRDERRGTSIPIAAWWIACPLPTRRCVVILHGYGDAKVGGIAWAPMWQRLGFHVLAIDLRAHGESGGVHSTAGFFERHDVAAVLNELRQARPTQSEQVVLFGVSLGAAVAINVAAERDDLAAIVVEAPFADYRSAIAAHAQIMQMPLPTLQPLAVRLAEWISGADFAAVRPADHLPRVRCPVLLIHGGDDPFVPRDDVHALDAAMQRRPESLRPLDDTWLIEHAPHVQGIVVGSGLYERRVGAFVNRALERATRPIEATGDA
jgi:pimeloyl-ACP methyl ester carboxylesterase